MRARRTRRSYIPAGSEQITDAESDAVIYVYEDEDARPSAVAFHGRAQKPDWHHWFRDDKARSNHIRTFFDKRRTHTREREARKAEEKAPHDFVVGDVLYRTWGLDETRVDVYQVTRVVSERSVELRKIDDYCEPGAEIGIGKSTPVVDRFTSRPFRRQVKRGSVLITSFSAASRWHGKPVGCTAYDGVPIAQARRQWATSDGIHGEAAVGNAIAAPPAPRRPSGEQEGGQARVVRAFRRERLLSAPADHRRKDHGICHHETDPVEQARHQCEQRPQGEDVEGRG